MKTNPDNKVPITVSGSGQITVWVTAVILIVLGLPLFVGGCVLALEGGSLYYLPAGLAILISGILLGMRKPGATLIYSALLVATLLWALWEAGLDGWALTPRLVMLAVVGLLFLLPPVRNASSGASSRCLGASILACVAAIAVAAGTAGLNSPNSGPTPRL